MQSKKIQYMEGNFENFMIYLQYQAKQNLYNMSLDLLLVENKSSESYYSIFYIEVISAHPDLTSSAFVFTIPSAGNYDISSQTGVTIGSVASGAASTQSYTNQSVSYQTSS